MSIQNIFTNGVLVDLHISAWTGEKQLNATDLGIPADKLPKAFKLGKKSLIPPEVLARFKHIDYLARRLLITSSFPFPFGSARFIPKTALVEFNDEFEELKAKYQLELEGLCANYAKYRLEMRTQFIAAAKAAYTRLSQIPGYEGLNKKDEKGNYTGEVISIDEFVDAFIDRIEACYPDEKTLRSKYGMSYFPFQMELPDLSQATIDDVAQESAKVELIQRGFQAKMAKELKEYAQKIVVENRARAQKVIDNLASNIEQGKRFTNVTMEMVENMIKSFSKLNIAGDTELEERLNAFKAKYLDPHSAKEIHNSDELQANMLVELKSLQELVRNAEDITALAEAYKQKINL